MTWMSFRVRSLTTLLWVTVLDIGAARVSGLAAASIATPPPDSQPSLTTAARPVSGYDPGSIRTTRSKYRQRQRGIDRVRRPDLEGRAAHGQRRRALAGPVSGQHMQCAGEPGISTASISLALSPTSQDRPRSTARSSTARNSMPGLGFRAG